MTAASPIRVLVVDDTSIYRKVVSDVLNDDPSIEVVGVAANGSIAMRKIEMLRPDLLTLDLEMPEMDGLEVLDALKDLPDAPGAIMLSAFTSDGAKSTMEALRRGAFDFALKPQSDSPAESMEKLRNTLIPLIHGYRRAHPPAGSGPAASPRRAAPPSSAATPGRAFTGADVVTIGISTGGPDALARMIPQLPADLSVPVLIVQHMPPMFTRTLAEDLDKRSAVTVVEGVDGQRPRPGEVIIAPGGAQMKVVRHVGQPVIRITDDPPEKNCRPAVDYLFRSVADVWGGRSLAVMMTGMGNDGAEGCALLKSQGAMVICQDQASCVVYGMPRVPAEQGNCDLVVPLEHIASEIVGSVRGRRAA